MILLFTDDAHPETVGGKYRFRGVFDRYTLASRMLPKNCILAVYTYHLSRGVFFILPLHMSRVTGACPVVTDLIIIKIKKTLQL